MPDAATSFRVEGGGLLPELPACRQLSRSLSLSSAGSHVSQTKKEAPGSVALQRRTPSTAASGRCASRPWRLSRDECREQRAAAARLLGSDGGGVNVHGLHLCLVTQELVDEGRCGDRDLDGLQALIDGLRQIATNDASLEEAQTAKDAVLDAIASVGLEEELSERLLRPSPSRQALCHKILPGLWLGGYTALASGCAELRKRGVTHVLSILSTGVPQLPPFVKKHLHICVDDNEASAAALFDQLHRMCSFIDDARKAAGCVFVHCGAGISRAPTVTAAYLVWKFAVSPAEALRFVGAARPCVRPNLGFVRQLQIWSAGLNKPGPGRLGPRK